ncbi:MAG: hypothetical protein B6D56_08120 [Candidatus Omnitrophica bacterium 4484_70.1]|nr:MAG: hypothetical protein B6D56_08120 [Candidatus Omnitrophica bacterium 4484_70.1]
MKIKKEIRKILENYSESNKMNFKPELEVPSLELCKRLKELGFPQFSGGWYWVLEELTYKEVWKLKLLYNIPYAVDNLKIKAPTCREMAFWIAKGVKKLTKENNDKIGYLVAGKELYWEVSPDDFAEDLIWLVENKHVKFENDN